jgi:stress-induced morphogen|tara:strand:- start:339 stop:572 length:234 start_codon:yes stop_codon:yes gene_type:complete
MGMKVDEIKNLILKSIPDAEIEIKDLAGDDNHYAATVKSKVFGGKTKVQQHKLVYDALEGRMGGVLHALSLTTIVDN